MAKTIVTHSELVSLTTCRYQHHLRYERGLKPDRQSSALSIGILTHQAYQFLYEHNCDIELTMMELSEAISDRIAVLEARDELTQEDWDKVAYERALVTAMIQAYCSYMLPQDDFTVLESEREIDELPIPTPNGRVSNRYVYSGKIDQVIQFLDGSLGIGELKTKAQFDASSLIRDDQIHRYLWAMQQMSGHLVNTVIYNVIKRSTLRPKTIKGYTIGDTFVTTKTEANRLANATALEIVRVERPESSQEFQARVVADYALRPEHYCVRVEIHVEQDLIDEAGENIYWMAREAHSKHAIYRTPGIHCNWCDAKPLCPRITEEALLGFVVKERKHEELKKKEVE